MPTTATPSKPAPRRWATFPLVTALEAADAVERYPAIRGWLLWCFPEDELRRALRHRARMRRLGERSRRVASAAAPGGR
jgi:hypothetical protein